MFGQQILLGTVWHIQGEEISYMKGSNLFPLVSHLAFSQHSLQCRENLGIQLLSNSAWNVCLLSWIVSEGECKGEEQNDYLQSKKKARGVTVNFLAYPSLFILTPNQTMPMEAPAQQAYVYNEERLSLARVYPYSISPCFTHSSLSPYLEWAYF